jgi:hypothetical protein
MAQENMTRSASTKPSIQVRQTSNVIRNLLFVVWAEGLQHLAKDDSSQRPGPEA